MCEPVLRVVRTFDGKMLADSIHANAHAFGYADCDETPAVPELQKRLGCENILALEALVNDAHAGVMWIHRYLGRVHGHIDIETAYRGRVGVELARIGIRWIWENTDITELWADCRERTATMAFDKAVGFKSAGTDSTGAQLLKIAKEP